MTSLPDADVLALCDTSDDTVAQVAHEYAMRGATSTATMLRTLLTERAALKADAERYRFLREQPDGFEITIRDEPDDPDFMEGEWISGHSPEEVDAAIDDARRRSE